MNHSQWPALPVITVLSLIAGLSPGHSAWAQSAASEAQQVLSLSASARKEVPQDWLSVTVRAQLEAADPSAVQTQLRAVVDAALAKARTQAQPQQLEVRTGSFGVMPRHNAQGRVSGWQGVAELVIEGRDFSRVSQLAAQLPRMTVAHAGFLLSKEGRAALETEVQRLAVQQFRQRAQALAGDFGFDGYTLRQVSVSSVDRSEPVTMARAMAADVATAVAPAAGAIPLEPGKEEVRISVSGNIQLR